MSKYENDISKYEMVISSIEDFIIENVKECKTPEYTKAMSDLVMSLAKLIEVQDKLVVKDILHQNQSCGWNLSGFFRE